MELDKIMFICLMSLYVIALFSYFDARKIKKEFESKIKYLIEDDDDH